MRHQFHENVRFCPKCGVESLDRDFYKQAEPRPNGGGDHGVKQIKNGTEWVCRICGFAFRIGKSCRHFASDELHRIHRQLRGNVTFDEKCVGKEIAEAYKTSGTGKAPHA